MKQLYYKIYKGPLASYDISNINIKWSISYDDNDTSFFLILKQ